MALMMTRQCAGITSSIHRKAPPSLCVETFDTPQNRLKDVCDVCVCVDGMCDEMTISQRIEDRIERVYINNITANRLAFYTQPALNTHSHIIPNSHM